MENSKKNLSVLALSFTSGGAEKVMSLLLKELKNDFNVTLVLIYNDIHFPIPKEVELIILSQNWESRPLYLKLYDFVRFTSAYNKLIIKKRIEISLSFLPFPNFINGIIAMRNSGIKTILSERSYPSNNPKNKTSLFISKVFYPFLYNKCDYLFSNSVHINDDLKNNFGIKIPMEVIYNPIEVPSENIIKETWDKIFNPFKIITVGSLVTKKNHLMIVRALQMDRSNYELKILGEGFLKDQIAEEIISSKLEKHILLEGKVKNVNEYLLKSHCFVLSSFAEGFPNALLEAMAIGLPCISTNCLSGPLEMLNENCEIEVDKGEFYKAKYGILINNDDSLALVNALNFLKTNPKECIEYSKLSLERSKKYQLKSIYSDFLKFIEK